MLMRWIRKLIIVGLAAFGAFRLFELVRLRVGPVKEGAAPHLHDAVERIRGAAGDVVGDVTDARHVVEDATQDVSADLGDAAHEVKIGAEAVAHDIKSVVVPPSPPATEPTAQEPTGEGAGGPDPGRDRPNTTSVG